MFRPDLQREPWTGGELIVLRTWRLVRWSEDDGLRLQSLVNSSVWHGPTFAADRRPEPFSSSGVYGIRLAARPRTLHEFDWVAGRDAWIWGWIALSGQVIEHMRGYRGERAVIRRLRLGVQAHLRWPFLEQAQSAVRELEARYQCPVHLGHHERRKAMRIRYFMEATGQEIAPLNSVEPPPPVTAAPPPVQPARQVPRYHEAPPRPPRRRKKEPVGTSAHGLEFVAVARAFMRAEELLGIAWDLKDRKQCPRVTLDARYSRIVRHVTRSWRHIYRPGGYGAVIMFPLAIVRRAARILKVNPGLLIGKQY